MIDTSRTLDSEVHALAARHQHPSRLAPVDPPFDDERTVMRTPMVDGQLALDLRGARTTRVALPSESGPPEPQRFAHFIVVATLEALHGVRSAAQLRRFLAPRVHAAVAARAACAVRRIGSPPPIVVRSTRADHVSEARVEACAVVEVAGRCRAVALRLQAYDGRWRVTALEMG